MQSITICHCFLRVNMNVIIDYSMKSYCKRPYDQNSSAQRHLIYASALKPNIFLMTFACILRFTTAEQPMSLHSSNCLVIWIARQLASSSSNLTGHAEAKPQGISAVAIETGSFCHRRLIPAQASCLQREHITDQCRAFRLRPGFSLQTVQGPITFKAFP